MNIGVQFSRYPAGRFPTDGKFNGETFRKKYLVDPLKSGQKVKITLDDAMDFGSSFLEEAFGGLIRVEKFPLKLLRDLLSFETTEHPFIPDEIWTYIEDEDRRACA